MAAYTEFAVLGGPSEEGDAADEGDAAENGFSLVIDEAITEVDDSGAAFTAFGFLATWRGQQSAGYRRFKEFRTLHTHAVSLFTLQPSYLPTSVTPYSLFFLVAFLFAFHHPTSLLPLFFPIFLYTLWPSFWRVYQPVFLSTF